MDSQILTGLVAALGLLANFAGVGDAAAADPMRQDGHAQHADHGHHHADFASTRMHVRVDGEAGPGVRDIILIPGLSSSPEVWQGTVDHLGAGWRVHRIHIQGFAGAPVEGNAEGPVAAPVAEEIARYIAENNLDKPVVVGHSMGGTIGMMLAARHPDAVGKLMVVDMIPFMGSMFAQPGVNPTVESVRPMVQGLMTQSRAASDADYRARAAATVSSMIKTEAERVGPLQETATSDRTVSQNAYEELLLTDLRPELGRISVPTEVVYVAFEFPGMTPQMTDGIYRASYANLPGVELKRIDDSAHFIMLDQPAEFYADLDALLAE
ncbi:alpha/beta hydrolase [Brevundimonas sp. NIBR11]|uniref:alpha/beta fold hydrolase n=1 Tax=Brevundimonas sp. NIBR11 TaxID=3015999 RepID=UPI0022F0B4A4|nr:alpha/beta hydrolase [Brevundimonas sp. NIBR11]WGM32508.1 Putative aminoacrylate hydrolase RutD [Brevundimonas sp. NIBR11]